MDISIVTWVLSIGVPSIIGIIVSCMMWISYYKALDHYRERRMEGPIHKKGRSKYVALLNISTISPLFFGIVPMVMLSSMGAISHPYQDAILGSIGFLIGAPLIVSMIGQGFLVSYLMRDYLIEKEPDPEDRGPHTAQEGSSPFARLLLISSIPQTIAIYGLILSILILMSSNIISDMDDASVDEEVDRPLVVDEGNVDAVRIGMWAFVGLSALSLPGALLPLLKKGSIMNKDVFIKRMILSCAGTSPSILGMAILISTMAL